MNDVLKIQGAQDEIVFWKKFIHTDQFKSWLQDKPAPELLPVVVDTVRKYSGRVLDVGSGVVSILQGVAGNQVTATDLLAEEYAQIFPYSAYEIRPPMALAAENLPFHHDYEVVHMRNALDHCQDPGWAWEHLKAALAPFGVLIVNGFVREGSTLRGLGMRQWDLYLKEDILMLGSIVTKKAVELSAENYTVLHAQTIRLDNGRDWFTWIGRKGI